MVGKDGVTLERTLKSYFVEHVHTREAIEVPKRAEKMSNLNYVFGKPGCSIAPSAWKAVLRRSLRLRMD